MAKQLNISQNLDKKERYEALLPQLQALLEGESDLTANLANTAAALRETMGFFWVGFYIVKENMLVLGPFQGPVACTRISFERGVCGACYRSKQTIVVEDTEAFPDHIACSSESRSEIVVPILVKGAVVAVLDVDSDHYGSFDETDAFYLEKAVELLTEYF